MIPSSQLCVGLMRDESCLLGRGRENVGVNVYASVSDQTSEAVQPLIAYTIFISACLQMCFGDIWLKQYFFLLLKILKILLRYYLGARWVGFLSLQRTKSVNLLHFTALKTKQTFL